MLKNLFSSVFIPLIVIIIGSLISAILILLAFGLGWLIRRVLPFSPFEATLLAMVAYITSGALIIYIIRSLSRPIDLTAEDLEEDDEMDEEDDLEIGPEKEPLIIHVDPKMARTLRRSNKPIPEVAPDARCPCGSGRKYKNCHGRRKGEGIIE